MSDLDRPANEPMEFTSVHGAVIYIQAGTHTEQVELEAIISDKPEDRPFGAAAWEEVHYPVVGTELLITSFCGINETFSLTLPDSWTAARVRVVSDRYREASEHAQRSEPIDPPEHIVVEFAPNAE